MSTEVEKRFQIKDAGGVACLCCQDTCWVDLTCHDEVGTLHGARIPCPFCNRWNGCSNAALDAGDVPLFTQTQEAA